MKKLLTLALAVLLTMLSVQPTFAATKEEKFTEKVKTEIAKLGTGADAKIKVKLKDGTKLKGYITLASENQFVVMNSRNGQAVAVDYSQVGQANGNNLSSGAKFAIFVGVALAVSLAFIFIAGSQLK